MSEHLQEFFWRIGLLAATCAGVWSLTSNSWEQWAVKAGAAHYDQRTGAWTEGPAVTTGEVTE
jgi:hypothetical protein